MDIHLQGIADLLITSHSQSLTANLNKTGGIEDMEEDTELRSVQPCTIQDDRPLPIWEACREWLRLMVSYFEAGSIISQYVGTYGPSSISIKVVGIPHQGQEMLSWRNLLSIFFTMTSNAAETVTEGALSDEKSHSTSKDYTTPESPTIPGEASDSDLEYSTDSSSEDGSEDLDTDATWVNELADFTSADEFIRAILILRKNSPYFADAFNDDSPLSMGDKFTGTIHCEAFIACLIYLAHSTGAKIDGNDLLHEFSVCYS
jgi:hypothetical protein